MDLVTNVVTGSNADRLLLLLHGYGADERDLGGLLGHLDPDGRFAAVLPRGPIAAPPGFSWFDGLFYRFLVIPRTRTGIVEQSGRFSWFDRRPPQGPARQRRRTTGLQ